MSKNGDNLIVFDWNGTILADTAACLHATNTVLDSLGLSKASRAHYQRHYTMPLSKMYHALGIEPERLEKIAHEINPLWHATYSTAKIRLRRGAKTMLQSLRLDSCRSIILSNYVERLIDAQAQQLGVREHFDDIIAFHVGDATFRKQGKGARLQEYLQTHRPRTGLIIGDSEEEIDIGRTLGLATVAITDGMCSTARLRAKKPDFLIRSLSRLPAIAHQVFGHQKGLA